MKNLDSKSNSKWIAFLCRAGWQKCLLTLRIKVQITCGERIGALAVSVGKDFRVSSKFTVLTTQRDFHYRRGRELRARDYAIVLDWFSKTQS